jgi:hypothetical protein
VKQQCDKAVAADAALLQMLKELSTQYAEEAGVCAAGWSPGLTVSREKISPGDIANEAKGYSSRKL